MIACCETNTRPAGICGFHQRERCGVFAAERPSPAAAGAASDKLFRKTRSAPAVGCSAWFGVGIPRGNTFKIAKGGPLPPSGGTLDDLVNGQTFFPPRLQGLPDRVARPAFDMSEWTATLFEYRDGCRSQLVGSHV